MSAVAVACALPFAILAAVLLANRHFPGKFLIDGLLHMPLVLPPVVIGYLLLLIFGTRAPVGAWLLDHFGIRFVFSWTGAALASGLITFPFQVGAIRFAIESIDPRLREAAETLGAGRLDRPTAVRVGRRAAGTVCGNQSAWCRRRSCICARRRLWV